ncbi:MAG TPA: hypothetical protein VF520_13420 [Thermoleophilaceae bacterium]|jgi:hypothetical protein
MPERSGPADVHLRFPVQVEVVRVGREESPAAPPGDPGPATYHFPVEIEVRSTPAPGNLDAAIDEALDRLARSLASQRPVA